PNRLTLPEAAAKFGLDLRTLQQAAKAGTLTATPPSPWLTTDVAVQEWIATKRRGRPGKTQAAK
ncbi:MAG TPA: hypothetical protein VF157_10390, partial [Chloroflexota bacterium]